LNTSIRGEKTDEDSAKLSLHFSISNDILVLE